MPDVCFVVYAMQDAHHSYIDDSEVIVDYNRQQLMPGWIPRRLGQLDIYFTWSVLLHKLKHINDSILFFSLFVIGGGLGGRKESGQLRFGGRERPFRAPLYVLFNVLYSALNYYINLFFCDPTNNYALFRMLSSIIFGS